MNARMKTTDDVASKRALRRKGKKQDASKKRPRAAEAASSDAEVEDFERARAAGAE